VEQLPKTEAKKHRFKRITVQTDEMLFEPSRMQDISVRKISAQEFRGIIKEFGRAMHCCQRTAEMIGNISLLLEKDGINIASLKKRRHPELFMRPGEAIIAIRTSWMGFDGGKPVDGELNYYLAEFN